MRPLTIARLALVLCVLAAATAAFAAWPDVSTAEPSVAMAEAWRMIGFATFAALFGLLAVRPAQGWGLWAVLIANKLVLSVSGATWLSNARGGPTAAAWDGTLTVLLLVALLLVRPWRRDAGVGAEASREPATRGGVV